MYEGTTQYIFDTAPLVEVCPMIDDSHFNQNTDNSTELPEITSGAQQINIASLSTVPTTNSGEMFYMTTYFHTLMKWGDN